MSQEGRGTGKVPQPTDPANSYARDYNVFRANSGNSNSSTRHGRGSVQSGLQYCQDTMHRCLEENSDAKSSTTIAETNACSREKNRAPLTGVHSHDGVPVVDDLHGRDDEMVGGETWGVHKRKPSDSGNHGRTPLNSALRGGAALRASSQPSHMSCINMTRVRANLKPKRSPAHRGTAKDCPKSDTRSHPRF